MRESLINTHLVDKVTETKRIGKDLLGWNPKGALNSTMIYLVMGIDDGQGRMILNEKDKLEIKWEGAADDPIFNDINNEILEHAKTLGGTFIKNFRWSYLGGRNLITAHPLGGCSLGADCDHGVVDEKGRIFD